MHDIAQFAIELFTTLPIALGFVFLFACMGFLVFETISTIIKGIKERRRWRKAKSKQELITSQLRTISDSCKNEENGEVFLALYLSSKEAKTAELSLRGKVADLSNLFVSAMKQHEEFRKVVVIAYHTHKNLND